ncbi:MAG: aldo/keto reductase [Clostridia bacterium]|nr:aldo/keto reductase [Clostridia bacterium]MBR3809735.1 aldo/keto reductase [Clostridia bacterium]
MKYSEFSNIQGKVSKLGFGLMRLPKLYEGKEDIDFKEAEKLVDLAYKNGVNYFDTAYVYHGGESEIFAGKILNKYPRESYNLATKLPGWAIKNDNKTVDELFNEQLEKCETEYFDFYLLHSLNRDIWNTFKSVNAYENLKEKKAQGQIRHLGFSFHGDMELFKELLENYEWDFVQLQINYYDWEADNAKDFYKLLEDKNIPCIVMEPVRGGSLQKLNDEAVEVFKKLSDNSPASYALRFVAQLPNVLTTLSGMSTYEQVEDNINTFNECKPLSDEEMKAIDRANILFRKNFSIPCTACKYCVTECPKGIDIPSCFSAFNEYNATRDIQDLNKTYLLIPEEKRANNCIDCKKCMEHCPQEINIPRKLSNIKDLTK